MQIFLMIVYALLVLTGLIVVHEYGHYRVAKKNGIKVDEFAIGFGPKLIKWHRGETEFSLRPFLIGGFCRFADDVDEEDRPPKPGDFRTAPIGARVKTVVAGPLMNALLAVVLAFIMLLVAPEAQGVQIREVAPGSPAEAAGLQEGDVIRRMNGIDMDFYISGISAYQQSAKGDTMEVLVERDGEPVDALITFPEGDGEKTMGIVMESHPYNVFEAFALSFKWLWQQTVEIFSALGNLFFRGQGVENMTGIVGLTVVVGSVVQAGALGMILMIVAMISINLAIVNLLPIPALDGGKLVLYAVEGARKKPVSINVEGVMNLIGMVAFMGFAVFLVFQDIGRFMGA
ncbi:MAG: site-2 protease family protein [Clostridia bacterium]|nr:site-2 protease family protein [Clostridia bacterium]